MKILIIEDEYGNFLWIKNLLSEINPGWNIDGPLRSCNDVREFFNRGDSPDLVLADIRLEDGLIFDAFDKIQLSTRLIFTTAYSEYAVKSFDYNCLHYLLKPIDRQNLKNAIDKAFSHIPDTLNSISGLGLIKSASPSRQRFLVDFRDTTKIIHVNDVAFLSLHDGTVKLTTFNGEIYTLDQTLDTYAGQLDGNRFFRVSRQYIINESAIDRIINFFNGKGKLILKEFPSEEIMISRERVKDLKKWLNS